MGTSSERRAAWCLKKEPAAHGACPEPDDNGAIDLSDESLVITAPQTPESIVVKEELPDAWY